MKNFLFLLFMQFSCFVGQSKTIDVEIAEAMNKADWFALDSIYSCVNKDLISDFLEVYSRFMIGTRLNRPEMSIPAFEELLENHYKDLNLKDLINGAVMCAMDMSREGDNADATSILTTDRDRITQDGKTDADKILDRYIKQYSALAEYKPYNIKIEEDTGIVAFKLVPIGKPQDGGMHIHLGDSYINDKTAEITFDTGAGVNVISSSLVEQYGLILIDAETKVSGAKSHNGTFAIAKEMKIGNIVVSDVPFYVMDITANNIEADQYMQSINIIIGSEIMLHLKDITIDFENSCIRVPAKAPLKTERKPNLCLSLGMNLLARGSIHSNDLLMNIDTGDSGYGSIGKNFYKKNKKYVKSHGKHTTVRKAGIGGVKISKVYRISDITLNLGGNTVDVPSVDVMEKTDCFGYDCNLGLKSLKLYKSVRFNLVDFVITTE